MLQNLFDRLRAGILAVLVHILLLGVLVFSLDWTPKDDSSGKEPGPEIVKAVAVDQNRVEAELKTLRDAEQAKRQAEDDRQKKLQQDALKAQEARRQEEARLAAAKRELAERIAKANTETERLAELQRKQQQAEAQRKRAAEEKDRADADRRKAQQEKARLEAEKKRLQEEQRQAEAARREAEQERARVEAERKKAEQEKARIEAEKKRIEQEKKRIEQEKRVAEEARRKAEEEQQRRLDELALQDALAEETAQLERTRQDQLSRYQSEYRAQIHDRVTRNWRRPTGMPKGLTCTVRVFQIPGGEITQVKIITSSGNEAFDQSVEKAVLKASPLPLPRDPSLFARKIEFIFAPED